MSGVMAVRNLHGTLRRGRWDWARQGSFDGLGAGSDGREGRGWEGLVRVGCQGWLGCAFEVGCYWVPAPFGRLRAGSDAGMAEGKEDGRVTGAAPTEDRTEGWFDTVFRGLQTGSPRTGAEEGVS